MNDFEELAPHEPQPITRPYKPAEHGPTIQRAPMREMTYGDGLAVPASDDAERGILSCFLQSPALLLPQAAEMGMTDEWFYHPGNRLLYEEMHGMQSAGRMALDLVTLSQHLLAKKLMDKVGGPAFMAELLNFVPTPVHFSYYFGISRDLWILRKAIKFHQDGIARAYEHQADVGAYLDNLEMEALKVRPGENEVCSDDFGEGMRKTHEAIGEQMNRGDALPGYSTGLPWLDLLIGGLRPGLYVIGARPAEGKTALLLQILRALAIDQEIPCGFFSLEMNRDRINRRMISSQGWIPLSAVLSGKLDLAERRKLNKACEQLWNRKMKIDDRKGLTIQQVRAKGRRWVTQEGIKVLALDYIQRMKGSNPRHTTQEMHAENSSGLADLAGELGIPIIVLAQLNRDCEKRPGQQPRMSDAEGCGRIEQDADIFLLLKRLRASSADNPVSLIDLILDKNRDGATDKATHEFNGPFQRFLPDPIEDVPEGPREKPKKKAV